MGDKRYYVLALLIFLPRRVWSETTPLQSPDAHALDPTWEKYAVAAPPTNTTEPAKGEFFGRHEATWAPKRGRGHDSSEAWFDFHHGGHGPKDECSRIFHSGARACHDDIENQCAGKLDPISLLQCMRDNAASLTEECGDHLKEWDAIGCNAKMTRNACWGEIGGAVAACERDTAKFCIQDANDPRHWKECIRAHHDALSGICKAAVDQTRDCMKERCGKPSPGCGATMMFYGEGPPGGPRWGKRVAVFVAFVAAISCFSALGALALVWALKRCGCCKCCARTDMAQTMDYDALLPHGV